MNQTHRKNTQTKPLFINKKRTVEHYISNQSKNQLAIKQMLSTKNNNNTNS